MKRIKIVLLCLCILFCLPSCTNNDDSDILPTKAEEVNEILIPDTILKFYGNTAEEMYSDFLALGHDYYTDIRIQDGQIALKITELQKESLINRLNGYIDDRVNEFCHQNSAYKFVGDSEYKNATYYFDEKLDVTIIISAVYAVLGYYAMINVLKDSDHDWNVHLKIYNCHTNKLVAEGDVAHERVSWDDEDWARSYEY